MHHDYRDFLEVFHSAGEADWDIGAPSSAGSALRVAVRVVADSSADTIRENGSQLGEDDDPAAVVAISIFSLECVRRQADVELGLLIAEGLYLGLSWQQMAAVLGVTRQALHKRYSDYVDLVVQAVDTKDPDELRDAAGRADREPNRKPLEELLAKLRR